MNNKSGSESRMTQCTRCGTTELRQSCPKCDDLSYLQKLCEEQKGEIERWRNDARDYGALSIKYESQLAAQTERVRRLEVALTDIRGLHTCCNQCAITSGEGWCTTYQITKESLKQDSLGDGKQHHQMSSGGDCHEH